MTIKSKHIFVLRMDPYGKARPRMSGHAYLPQEYRVWKQRAALCFKNDWQHKTPLRYFIADVCFYTHNGDMRPDRDNAIGSVLDALQDAGVIENDKYCRCPFVTVGVAPPEFSSYIEVILYECDRHDHPPRLNLKVEP